MLGYAPGVYGNLKHIVWVVVCVAAAASGRAWALSETPAPPIDKVKLLAAQEPNGLWVVVPDNGSGFELLHQPPQAPRDTLYIAMPSKGRPIALAATTDKAYLVYEDMTAQSVTFTWSARQGLHGYEPEQLMPLPKGAQLIDFNATAAGPLALVAEPKPDGQGDDDVAPKQLLAYRGGAWEPIATPQPLGDCALVVLDAANDEIALVETEPGHTLALHRRQGEAWSRAGYGLTARIGESRAVGVMGQILVLAPPAANLQAKPGHEVQINVSLLHPDGRSMYAGLLPLPASPDLQHVPVAHGNSVRVIAKTKEGNLFITERSLFAKPHSEVAYAPLKVSHWPPVSNREMIVTGLLIVMTLTIIAIWRRDPESAIVRLPEGLAPAALSVRLSAALIDMAPAVAVAMFAFKITNPLEVLLPWPSFNQPPDQMLPGVVAFGVFVVHTTIGELTTGMSLGKRIMHCRVTNTTGGKPRAAGVLLRGVVRLIELFAWPLLLFVLLNRPHQRMGDLAARTVVVMGKAKQPADDDADHA